MRLHFRGTRGSLPSPRPGRARIHRLVDVGSDIDRVDYSPDHEPALGDSAFLDALEWTSGSAREGTTLTLGAP